jgi:CRISPR system Cascade subunit CasB
MRMSQKILYPFPQWKPDDRSFAILSEWWQGLENNKGDRAALRRSDSLAEVVFCPAYHWLLGMLRKEGYLVAGEVRLQKLAAIAGLAARIKVDLPGEFGKQFGAVKQGDKPAVSELRMRRILACDDLEELYMLLRRALGILGGSANLSGLAATIWQWESLAEKRPFDSRKQLAYDYYSLATIQDNN